MFESIVSDYNKQKKELDFFDVNLWWDPTFYTCFEMWSNFDEFYRSLKVSGISRAVLSLGESVRYTELSGNEHLKGFLQKYDGLYGAMVLTSDYLFTGEDVTKTIDEMVESGVRIIRMFPRTNRHPFKKSAIGDIFAHLNRRRIPLMLWHAEVSWDTIESLCADFPDMPVIIEGNDVKLLYHNRFYVPLYKKYPNFYLETHNLIIFKELDILAGIDPSKLLFGSYHQYNNPNAAMASVILAELDDQTKRQIAHGNLEALIDGIR